MKIEIEINESTFAHWDRASNGQAGRIIGLMVDGMAIIVSFAEIEGLTGDSPEIIERSKKMGMRIFTQVKNVPPTPPLPGENFT